MNPLLPVVIILALALLGAIAILAWFYNRAAKIQADLLNRLMSRSLTEYKLAAPGPRPNLAPRAPLSDEELAKREKGLQPLETIRG